MRLLRIDTNKGNKVDGGFRHTIFESQVTNGRCDINIIESAKFNEVLSNSEWIEHYTKDPKGFLKNMSEEDTSEIA